MRFRRWIACIAGAFAAVSTAPMSQAALIAPNSTTPLAQLISPDPKAVVDLEKSIESFKRRDYDQALKLLKEVREKHPSLPNPNVLLAQLFMGEGQAAAARAFLERAALDSIDDPMLYIAFGNAALLEGRVTDAQLQFEKARSLLAASKLPAPEKKRIEEDCWEGMTAVGEARSDWKFAQTAITEWLKLQPKNGKARQRLARAIFNQDKAEVALKELEQASKDDPKLPSAAAALGTFYISKSNNEKAEEWLNKAVADNPKDASALATLASWQLQRGRFDEAKTNAEAASKLDPQSIQYRGLVGAVLMFQKNFAGAEKVYEELFQKQPAEFSVSNQLARALAEQPDSAKQQRALQFAEMNARQFPRNIEALSTLGRVYYRLGRLDDSEKVLKQVMQSGRATQDSVYFLAYVLADRGQLDEVRKILKSAVDAKGNFVFRKDAEEWLARMSAKP